MKLSHAFLGALGPAISNALMLPVHDALEPFPIKVQKYEPSGSVLGDFTSIRKYHPKLILNFLATCSDVTFSIDSCLVSTFAELRVPMDVSTMLACGDSCTNPPKITETMVMKSVMEAETICAAAGEADSMDLNDLVESYDTLLKASDCWLKLRDDEAFLSVEASWINSCAAVNLPYPQLKTDPVAIRHDAILTCMLDNLFDASPPDFGLEAVPARAQEVCFPPGYNDIAPICASTLGPMTFSKCYMKDPQMISEGPGMIPMSMDYNGEEQATFVYEFCYIVSQLSSGRNCLLEICDYGPMLPSMVPSMAPSSVPSDSPSLTLSDTPTVLSPSLTNAPMAPTPAPLYSNPTNSTTAAPTRAPTQAPTPAPISPPPTPPPTLAPTQSPLSSPTPPPTRTRTLAPTVSPTKAPILSSPMPTTATVQATVGVTLFSQLSLNIAETAIPSDRDSFIDVIETSIEDVIDGESTVKVYLPTGLRRMRRSLQQVDSLNLDVMITANRECRSTNCTKFAITLLDEIDESLKSATLDGTLETSINAVAQNTNVIFLERVVVGQYQLVNETSKVTATEKEMETASSAVGMTIGLSLLATVASSLLL